MNDFEFETRCDEFEASYRRGDTPRIENFLKDVPETEAGQLFKALLEIEIEYCLENDHELSREKYRTRFPDFAKLISEAFQEAERRFIPETACRRLATAGDADRRPGEPTAHQATSQGLRWSRVLAKKAVPNGVGFIGRGHESSLPSCTRDPGDCDADQSKPTSESQCGCLGTAKPQSSPSFQPGFFVC